MYRDWYERELCAFFQEDEEEDEAEDMCPARAPRGTSRVLFFRRRRVPANFRHEARDPVSMIKKPLKSSECRPVEPRQMTSSKPHPGLL